MTPSIEEVLFFKRDTIFIILVKNTFIVWPCHKFPFHNIRFTGQHSIRKESSACIPKWTTHTVWKYCFCCFGFYWGWYFYHIAFLLCSHSILFNCLVRLHLCFLSFFLNSLVERFTRSISDIAWITPKPLVIWIPWRRTKTSKSLLR